MSYLFFKWLHVIGIISWMAGLLYLFRLFLNHRKFGTSSQENHILLAGMEDRLYKIITVPAMVISWAAGLAMISLIPALFKQGWLHGKIILVLLLTLMTFYAGKLRNKAAVAPNHLPSVKQLRIINEIPTVIMMIIVALVIFKPF